MSVPAAAALGSPLLGSIQVSLVAAKGPDSAVWFQLIFLDCYSGLYLDCKYISMDCALYSVMHKNDNM